MGMARSVAYRRAKPKGAEAQAAEEAVKKRIDYWHTLMPYLGTRKISQKLGDEDGLRAGRKLVRRYMSEMGIRAIYPKPNLSKPGQGQQKLPYLLKNKAIYLPNQVWAIDITYIPMARGHMYLTAIIDWFSRYIVGWMLSDSLETANVLEAVSAAIAKHGTPGIINSDQGSQFTSDDYKALLKRHSILQSMDGKARWIDNVIIERWFRSLKWDDIYINEYNSPKELRRGIAAYIRDYNELRPHQSLGYKTPIEVYHSAFHAKQKQAA